MSSLSVVFLKEVSGRRLRSNDVIDHVPPTHTRTSSTPFALSKHTHHRQQSMAGRLASAASASAACLLFLLLVSLDSVRGFRHAQASLPSSHRGRAATPPPVAAAAPPSAGDGEQQQPQQQPQQQSMSLLFPPTRRPTSIVFEDRRNGIWTFEQRTCVSCRLV